ncbi:MAG TPA: response regulator transcription factor [Chloroflexota bacterium]|jgi:DNA-binding response OmpR family regulator|nr:response regulator transcription factor [Chloroflexota bacterium]
MADVLVVEDEESLLHTLRYNLTRAGHVVRLCTNGARALELVRAQPPDLLLLDLMLPDLDGLEITRALRREHANPAVNRVPILILTARDAEIDKVVGLEVGADDYVTKPFSMHELLARVKALVRRAAMSESPPLAPQSELHAGDLVIDPVAHRATRAGRMLRLKPREYELLSYLVQHPNQVHSRERLLLHVWGYEFVGDTRTVDVHVRWLRDKIEPDPTNPTRIQTVRGAGYLFTE